MARLVTIDFAQAAMEGLDASYALLNDVNVRNRELQARLRSSLPLLWTDNALVLKSAVPRRRRGGGVIVPAEESAQSEADQLLLALEGHPSLQVSRRYRRRVEWEVARRIARVDRELQQYPPNQRFWNQKRKEAAPPPTSNYRQRGNAVVEKSERAGDEEKVERRQEVEGERKPGVNHRAARSGFDDKVAVNQQKKTSWMKPDVKVNSLRRVAVKHVATSPVRGGVEDEENAQPNSKSRPKMKTSDMRKLTSGTDVSPSKLLGNGSWNELQVAKDLDEGDKSKDPVDSPESSAASSTIGPLIEHADTTSGGPSQEHSSPVDDTFKKAKEENDTTASQEIDDTESMTKEQSSHRSRAPVSERSSSSIGRQILSEFRTMPSVASFGAQPILSAGGLGNPGDKRLNADALRRLFSDLDADKDGHVNRIETCMALHRLQIAVPTTKIISFFRNIHASDGKGVRSRRAQHMPLNEVINYKEFVAFVTAAYDQQQQQKARRNRAPARRKLSKEDRAKPSSAPSTSCPIYAHPMNPPKKPTSSAALLREQEVRLYEMSDVDSEPGAGALEDRVMKVIPDFLVSKMLADVSGPVGVEAKEAAASVVRRSLESLVGEDVVDEKMVKEITQGLIKAKLLDIGSKSQGDHEDITGLRRAAAYYKEQMMCGDADTDAGSAMEDSSSEDLANWMDILTEEQVGCLVQQLWKDRQSSLQHAPLGTTEDVTVEEHTEMSEEQTIKWIDEATDTNELSGTAALSEKGVQVSDQEEAIHRHEDVTVAAPPREPDAVETLPPALTENAELEWPSQTHLGGALGISLRHYGHGDTPDNLFSPVTSVGILQHLRQQRRLHQSTLHNQHALSSVHEPVKHSQERSRLAHGELSISEHVEVLDRESILSSEEESESASDPRSDQDHQRNRDDGGLMPLPTTEPVARPPRMMSVDVSVSDESSLDVVSSVSASSSSSISKHHHVNSIYREIDRHQLHARPIRRRRPRQRRRRLSVSGSSVPDSICSAELSEGELAGDEVLDLSDGEIFGDWRRKCISRKNAASRVLESTDDGDNLLSSVESGELPPVVSPCKNVIWGSAYCKRLTLTALPLKKHRCKLMQAFAAESTHNRLPRRSSLAKLKMARLTASQEATSRASRGGGHFNPG
jgi:hypothetical protein